MHRGVGDLVGASRVISGCDCLGSVIRGISEEGKRSNRMLVELVTRFVTRNGVALRGGVKCLSDLPRSDALAVQSSMFRDVTPLTLDGKKRGSRRAISRCVSLTHCVCTLDGLISQSTNISGEIVPNIARADVA